MTLKHWFHTGDLVQIHHFQEVYSPSRPRERLIIHKDHTKILVCTCWCRQASRTSRTKDNTNRSQTRHGVWEDGRKWGGMKCRTHTTVFVLPAMLVRLQGDRKKGASTRLAIPCGPHVGCLQSRVAYKQPTSYHKTLVCRTHGPVSHLLSLLYSTVYATSFNHIPKGGPCVRLYRQR